MATQGLSGTTALVTGASRGFGRSIAVALAGAGAHVVGVARDRTRLDEVRTELGDGFTPVAGDATDPVLAGQLIDRYRPRTLVLNAGAVPLSRPLHQHTWQSFSRNWEVDVQHVFHWTREALLAPLDPGSVVIAFSSGAVRHGSPVSGGYAGAKATIKFIASYAAAGLFAATWLVLQLTEPAAGSSAEHASLGPACAPAVSGVGVSCALRF